eukprot:PhM_4_TR4003/c0_g2_i1/m.82590
MSYFPTSVRPYRFLLFTLLLIITAQRLFLATFVHIPLALNWPVLTRLEGCPTATRHLPQLCRFYVTTRNQIVGDILLGGVGDDIVNQTIMATVQTLDPFLHSLIVSSDKRGDFENVHFIPGSTQGKRRPSPAIVPSELATLAAGNIYFICPTLCFELFLSFLLGFRFLRRAKPLGGFLKLLRSLLDTYAMTAAALLWLCASYYYLHWACGRYVLFNGFSFLMSAPGVALDCLGPFVVAAIVFTN